MNPDFRYQADMGFTREELLKGLATAVYPFRVKLSSSESVEIVQDEQLVLLTTGADSFRSIASMRIPKLAVSLEFFGFTDNQYKMFMHRFQKYLHKGGG